jgi:hypothetical protein
MTERTTIASSLQAATDETYEDEDLNWSFSCFSPYKQLKAEKPLAKDIVNMQKTPP